MEEAPAMDTQQTAAEQPADAALPAAETAAETPAPIAAPPGVPMKAPPPSLLAKEEPKEHAPAPEIGQLITLSEDLQVVRFTNGTIHLKQKGKDPEAITPSMFEALIQSIRSQANAPAPSAMSGFTGLASTNRGSAPDTDSDPIEWGDMDPNFRQALQDSPELLKAYNTVRNPKKVAKLDPATISFTPTTNIELPPPSVETPPPQVTMENLSTVLATYHEQTVQPSLDLLSNHIRQDVISRLDKQGSVIRYEGLALQSLEADAIRRTVLIHGLPPFTTKSQIDHNLHYLLQQAQLTESDIQTTSNHVNTSTNAFLKITFLQESTSKHFFQTFKQKKRWYHSNEHEDAPLRIERDVPMLERIERTPLHAVVDSLTKPQPPAMDEYLRCDFNSLQVWDNAEESLLAQVLYLPDKHLSYACYLLVVPRFFEEVRTHFPRFFGDKLASTIQFMQAYASASRHATTALRYHFSQAKDVSNLSREDAIRSFPYPIYPVELNDELSTQLSKNPNFILQGFLGMQTQIQQAVSDLGINLEDYGRKGKGTTRNKGKGKGKRPERNKGYQSDMYRNQAEEEEDTEEDYKPKGGKGSWRRGNDYWDRSSSSRDTGKGSHSQWDNYRHPASSRIEYTGPKDRPDKWWKARDFEEYDPRFDDLVQDSTRRRREDDRQQEGRHTRQRGRGLDDPTLLFPCEECMALAGTNTSCSVCHYKYQTYFEKLKKSQSLPNLAKSPQDKLPSFPCPFPLNEEAELCDGGQAPSFFGHGKCAACKALRMYYVRLYGGDDAEAINPYHHTLIVGYERSIIEYLEDTTATLQQAICDLTYEDLHEKQTTDVQNWFYAVAFPEDILAKLPRNYVDPKYEPHKSSFLRTKWPQWKHLNRAIAEANPHSYSRMMMLFEAALRPAMEEMLYCFDLPSPSRVPGFADMGWDDSSLVVQDLIPWRELIRQSYALAMERHGIPKEWDPSCIKQLCHSLFSDQHEYLFEQSVDHLCDAIFRDEDLWTIFAGFAPWTNDTLKKLASSGSWYFDLVYYQITALFKCQTTKKQDLPAPNDQFVMFYDAMVDRLPRHHPLVDEKAHLLSRHWNNKGNSMEALMLLIAETGAHDLVWSVGYIIMNLQFRKQRLPWIEDYLHA